MKEAKNRERTKEREWEKERNTTEYSCPLTSLGLVRAVFKIVPFIRWGGIPCSGVTIPFCFSAWPFTCPFFGFFLCFLYLTLQNTTDTKKNGNTVMMGRIRPIYWRSILMSSHILVFKVTTFLHKIVYALRHYMPSLS